VAVGAGFSVLVEDFLVVVDFLVVASFLVTSFLVVDFLVVSVVDDGAVVIVSFLLAHDVIKLAAARTATDVIRDFFIRCG
jgi:hypothetical protein